jgi:hypothetical protein
MSRRLVALGLAFLLTPLVARVQAEEVTLIVPGIQ